MPIEVEILQNLEITKDPKISHSTSKGKLVWLHLECLGFFGQGYQ